MDPTDEEAKAGIGAFMNDRLTAITVNDPTLKIFRIGEPPGGVWYSFSDGSSLEFQSERASDGTQHVTSWTITKH